MPYWYQTKIKMRLIIVNNSFYISLQKQSCGGVLYKKVFLEISQNSQENTCASVSFLVKLQASSLQFYFIKKETLTQVISCEFCEISKNTSGDCFCHLSKYFDKLYGNIDHKMQIQMSSFSQVPASLVFAVTSEFWFSGFSRHTIHKLITAVTAFLIAFLIKINNKKLDRIISKLLTLCKYFTCSLILFCTCETFLNIPRGIYIIIDNNCTPLILF